jgi:hypothetical protein
VKLDEALVRDVLSDFLRRSEAAKAAGAVTMQEVYNGAREVPPGWVLDDELDMFVPPGVSLSPRMN